MYIVLATTTKTNVQVNIDNVVTDLNGKADRDLSNAAENISFIVDNYRSGASWYRKWSDGWVEQGGTVAGNNVVTFLLPFADDKYSCNATVIPNSSQNLNTYSNAICTNKTSTSIKVVCRWETSYEAIDTSWYACGQGA